MSAIEWKDESSYSRSDVDRTPRAWSAEFNGIKVSVHRHIHHGPDVWLVTCRPWFDCRELASKAAPIAKRQALEMVADRLQSALSAIVGAP